MTRVDVRLDLLILTRQLINLFAASKVKPVARYNSTCSYSSDVQLMSLFDSGSE